MTEYSMVYTTFADKNTAIDVLKTLLSEQLIACGNIIDGMTAVYNWKDKVEQANEVVVLIKAKSVDYEAIEKRIKELHAYEIPCIFKLDIDAVFAPYASWIDEVTKK